jgi:hypothetical protein
MQYAERLPALPSARTVVVPVVALVIGAAAATGTYALLDDDKSGSQATAPRVIVAEPPAQPGEGVGAKNEAGVAAAIGSSAVSPATEPKDEAGVAAAIGSSAVSPATEPKDEAGSAAAVGQSSGGAELRGSKASADGTSQR